VKTTRTTCTEMDRRHSDVMRSRRSTSNDDDYTVVGSPLRGFGQDLSNGLKIKNKIKIKRTEKGLPTYPVRY